MTRVNDVSDLEQHLLEQIKESMRLQGITQTSLATKLNTSRQALSPVFTGQRRLVTPTFERILELLNLELTVQPKMNKS